MTTKNSKVRGGRGDAICGVPGGRGTVNAIFRARKESEAILRIKARTEPEREKFSFAQKKGCAVRLLITEHDD